MNRRRINYNEPGHAHQLNFSCYRRFQFLKADRTCQWLAEAICKARNDHRFMLWAYVFMPEHVHLLIYPVEQVYQIQKIRKSIKAPVGEKAIAYLAEHAPHWLPRITRFRGSKMERLFWQSGGGFDRNITETATLHHEIDYIHMNPVRRGLVERAEDWHWSSAAWYRNGAAIPIPVDPISPDWLAD